MVSAHLSLHCGAREVTPEQLSLVPCPVPEGRWRPVPHGTVLTYATQALTDAGYQIEKMQLGLSRNDARFFGVLTLATPLVSGTALAVGIRSSTDKSFSLGFAYGARTFVCDNLAFRADRVIAKKHTTFGPDRYREAICRAVGELSQFRRMEADRICRMQQTVIADHYAEAILLRLYQDEGILSPRSLPAALKQWREPEFSGLEERSVWRLFSAVTFALNGRARSNPGAHLSATLRLGALLDVPPHAPQPTSSLPAA
jgi:hypothetical protein